LKRDIENSSVGPSKKCQVIDELAATTQKLIIEAAWKNWLPFHHH